MAYGKLIFAALFVIALAIGVVNPHGQTDDFIPACPIVEC